MRGINTSRIISTYTGDTSGVCSALFELGGMVVMHDPSGCNSTYSTHDEPRWYDTDSLIFISALTEKDAIFGNDEKIISDTVQAAAELNPRFIAIAGTPIPYMTGCDYNAIAAEIQQRCGIPAFGFDTDGMHSYIRGAGFAFAEYADKMCSSLPKSKHPSINILGVTPLDFSVNGSHIDLRKSIENCGITVNSVWAMGDSPEYIEKGSQAWINLVVSACGIECAKVMERKFGIPYVIGCPYGKGMTEFIISEIKTCLSSGKNTIAVHSDTNADTVIIGEPVTSCSLAHVIRARRGISVKVISPVDTPSELIKYGCVSNVFEDDIAEIIKSAKMVIADPMYRPICPPEIKFTELPHEAFSGRIYRSAIPNLVSDGEYFVDEQL